MSLTKLLLKEFNVHKDLQSFKEYLENNGILVDHDVEYYIGSGHNGDAYKVKGKDKVIKIQQYVDQDYLTFETIKQQNNLEHVAKVYFNKNVKGDLLLNVLEYLEKPDFILNRTTNFSILSRIEPVYLSGDYHKVNLDKVGDTIIQRINNTWGEYGNKAEKIIKTYKKLKQIYNNHQNLLKIITNILLLKPTMFRDYQINLKEIIEHKKLFVDVFKGIKEFEKMNIQHNDITFDNVLKDPQTGNYKLIDPYNR